jgi:regulator of ribonuclease activity A
VGIILSLHKFLQDKEMRAFSTPDLSDDHDEALAIELQFRNFGRREQFHGQVVTIKCHEDNSLVKACVGEAGLGRVIVVDGGGSLRRALLGDMLAEKAARSGWAGLVINGVVRDVDEIAEIDLGVKALGCCPIKTEKLGAGRRDIPLQIGGVTISPGQYIYADNNGVLVSDVPLL